MFPEKNRKLVRTQAAINRQTKDARPIIDKSDGFHDLTPAQQLENLQQRILALPANRDQSRMSNHQLTIDFPAADKVPRHVINLFVHYEQIQTTDSNGLRSSERGGLLSVGAELKYFAGETDDNDWRRLIWEYANAEDLQSEDAARNLGLLNNTLCSLEKALAEGEIKIEH